MLPGMEDSALSLHDSPRAPTGHFHLEVRRGDEIVEIVDEPNLIVTASTTIHANLLGGNVTNNSVTQISYGTNGTAPVVGNTTITAPFTKALDGVTYPAANQVAFAFSLATTEDNGVAIMEFGLLTAAGTLYARKVRALALNKASDLSLSGSWVISF
jgi:hypothetical protein